MEMTKAQNRRRIRLFREVQAAQKKQPHLPLKQIVRECLAEMTDECFANSEVEPDGQGN